MLALLPRKSLGFEDDFEGYVFLKENDPERPVLQFHLYNYESGGKYFHTLFWRGQTNLEEVSNTLVSAIEGICKQRRLPRSAMNAGSVYFAKENIFHNAGFQLAQSPRPPFTPVSVSSSAYYSDIEAISFVRFDIRNKLDLPITIWADLHGENTSEVGFSFSNMDVPDPIFLLFQNTCREEITAAELDELRRDIWRQSRVPVPA